jgi:hypothetical protein
MFGEKKMEAKSLNAASTEITDTSDSSGDSVNTNTDFNARFKEFQNRLDKMSDQMQVIRQKVLRLRKAIGNLPDSDE